MKAPIIINTANNKGCQMIMDNSEYQKNNIYWAELLKQKAEESSATKEDK
jgi:flagellar assembly factor FliW